MALRIFAFNLLLVFLPALGFFFLDSYEKQLLQVQERSMVQQGRFASAALEAQLLTSETALAYIRRLRSRHEARIRILDESGQLLADSSAEGPAAGTSAETPAPSRRLSETYDEVARQILPQDSFLYRLAIAPIRFWRRYIHVRPETPPADLTSSQLGQAPEVRAALEGRYGARTRVLGDTDPLVYLYSAIPIPHFLDAGRVQGVVLVTQSTFRILLNLYELRLDNLRFVLLGALAALILTFITARTVVKPLRQLTLRASTLLDSRGRLTGVFPLSRSPTELGQLSRSLHELSEKLSRHIQFIETFSQDLSHEIKNPLASISAALEVLDGLGPSSRQKEFQAIIGSEVKRLLKMISGIRRLSLSDAGLGESGDFCDPQEVLDRVMKTFSLRFPQVKWGVGTTAPQGGAGPNPNVRVSPEALVQVLDNLLENAAGFHGEASEALEVRFVRTEAPQEPGVLISVRDYGPGFSEEDRERIFERFFSTRKNEEGLHTGLGLSVVKAIVESSGGSVRAENAQPGARFVLWLPAV